MEDAQILAEPKRITTEFEISPDVKVLADESFLRRMLLNLLDNAIKYNVEEDPFLSRSRNPVRSRCFGLPTAGLESLKSMKTASSNDFIGLTPAALRTPVVPDWD